MIGTHYSKFFCLNRFYGHFLIHSMGWNSHSCLSARVFSRPILYHDGATNKKHLSNIYVPFHLLKVSLSSAKRFVKLQCTACAISSIYQHVHHQCKEKLCPLWQKNPGYRTENTYAELHIWILWKSWYMLSSAVVLRKRPVKFNQIYNTSFPRPFIHLMLYSPQRTSVLHSFQTHQSSIDRLLAGSH